MINLVEEKVIEEDENKKELDSRKNSSGVRSESDQMI